MSAPQYGSGSLPVGIPLVPGQSTPVYASYAVAPFVIPAEREREPMLLLDVTASMNWSTSMTDKTPRKETVREALSLLVQALEGHDSQSNAEHAAGIPVSDIGGLRTVTFSNRDAADNGDINSQNLASKWSEIKFCGGTYIMPGWQRVLQVFQSEFGERPLEQQPLVMLLIISDGAAYDMKEFVQLLKQELPSNFLLTFALIGYDNDYMKAVAEYNTLVQFNPAQVRVIPFGAETDPQNISNALLGLLQSK